MRLIQIEYFLAVVDHKSITRAAKHLYISQPALSKQMALLEEELGIKLMYRLSRGITLTEAGRQFEADCRAILSELENAKSRAIAIGEKETQVFHIGCFEGAIIEDFIQPLYAFMQDTFPEIRPKISRHNMAENRRLLEMNRIDMLIELTTDPEPKKGYRSKVLLKRQGGLVFSKSSPLAAIPNLSIRDFSNQPFLMLDSKENDGLIQGRLERLKELGLEDFRLEYVENFMTLMSNLNMGYGYALLATAVAETQPGLTYFDLPEEFRMNVAAVWKEKHPFTGALMEAYVPNHSLT